MGAHGDNDDDLALSELCLRLADKALAQPENGIGKAIEMLRELIELLELRSSSTGDVRVAAVLLEVQEKLDQLRLRLH